MEFQICTASVSRRFRLETHRGCLATIVDLQVRVRLPNVLSLSVLQFSETPRSFYRFLTSVLHRLYLEDVWRALHIEGSNQKVSGSYLIYLSTSLRVILSEQGDLWQVLGFYWWESTRLLPPVSYRYPKA